LHLSLLCAVPKLVGRAQGSDAKTYKEVALREPCSWFSANLLHCLRSKYLFKHSPACSFFVPGQEHLLEVNESIGCFFHEENVEVEPPCSYELRMSFFPAGKGGG